MEIFPFDQAFGISSGYGPRQYELNGKIVKDFHRGVDYFTPMRTPIRMIFDGTVDQYIDSTNAKYCVMIKKGTNFRVDIIHVSEVVVKPGKSCKVGDVVAYSGNSGANTTGPHSHIEVRADWVGGKSNYMDPTNWLKSLPLWSTVNVPSVGDKVQIGTTGQVYYALSIIARDLFNRSDWTQRSGWDYVLAQGNQHLWTGSYDTIYPNLPIFKIVEVPRPDQYEVTLQNTNKYSGTNSKQAQEIFNSITDPGVVRLIKNGVVIQEKINQDMWTVKHDNNEEYAGTSEEEARNVYASIKSPGVVELLKNNTLVESKINPVPEITFTVTLQTNPTAGEKLLYVGTSEKEAERIFEECDLVGVVRMLSDGKVVLEKENFSQVLYFTKWVRTGEVMIVYEGPSYEEAKWAFDTVTAPGDVILMQDDAVLEQKTNSVPDGSGGNLLELLAALIKRLIDLLINLIPKNGNK